MDPAMITLYGQPGCYPCKQAAAYLTREHVPFDYIDLTEHPEALEQLKAQGMKNTPVLRTPTQTTSGLNLSALQAAVSEYRSAQTSMATATMATTLTR